jgi:signal peptidase I
VPVRDGGVGPRESGSPDGPGGDGAGDQGVSEEPLAARRGAETGSVSDEGSMSDEDSRRALGHRGRWVLEWVAVLIVALGVALVVRAYVVQTFYIPSASMEPTLMIGDRILVDKLSYHLHAVHRGDIVVFAKPPLEPAAPGVKDLVKRVIGLPGETISSADGEVWIDGKPLAEPWLPKGTITTGITGEIPGCIRVAGGCKIPAGEYFVMGDNRGDSSDSRVFGPIPKSLIVGRVVFRIWPIDRIGFF